MAGREGLRDASGPGGGSALAPLVRVWEAAARPYCYPRGGGGERAAAGAGPAAAGGSVPPFGPARSPWRLVLPFGLAFVFIYFRMGLRSLESSLVAAEWKFCAPVGSFDFSSFRGSAEGGTIHRFGKRPRALVPGRDPMVVGTGRFLQALNEERWPSGSFGSFFKLLGFLVAFCFRESLCVSFFFLGGGALPH